VDPLLTREIVKLRTNPQLGSAIISSLESQIAGELEMAQHPKANQHAARIEGVLRDAPDVVEKMRKGSLSPIPQSVTREIYAYDNAPEMLVYLGRYEEERQALSRMSSQAAADAVRELSETLSAHTVRGNGRPANHAPATSRPVSAAPAPIPALRGTASASTLDPDEMDFQDFKAWREKNKRTYGVRR
jgi:hypothetical protein